MKGVEGDFTQANHGSQRNLKRLQKGDYIVFYSSKTNHPKGEKYQKFTALGQVTDDEPYQVEMSPDFHPFRRNLKFFEMKEASILPLIENLSFIKNKQRWGYMFRFGLFEIPEHDFVLISTAVGYKLKGK